MMASVVVAYTGIPCGFDGSVRDLIGDVRKLVAERNAAEPQGLPGRISTAFMCTLIPARPGA
jgi:hypothetical protein